MQNGIDLLYHDGQSGLDQTLRAAEGEKVDVFVCYRPVDGVSITQGSTPSRQISPHRRRVGCETPKLEILPNFGI